MKYPLVSVYMITYNHEQYIEQAIQGVLIQETSFKLQLVIGEDCSTDRTREICEKYAQQFPEIIRLLPSEKNLGMRENAHRTLNECKKSKYIAMCEGDDYWTDSHKLQKQVSFLEKNPSCSLTCHNVKRINTFGEVKEGDKYLSNQEIILSRGKLTPTLSLVFRKSQIKRLPPWFYISPVGDIAFVYHLMMVGKVYCFSDMMGVYRVNTPGSWSNISKDYSLLRRFLFSVRYAAFIQSFDKFSNNTYSIELRKSYSPSYTLRSVLIQFFAYVYRMLLMFSIQLLFCKFLIV